MGILKRGFKRTVKGIKASAKRSSELRKIQSDALFEARKKEGVKLAQSRAKFERQQRERKLRTPKKSNFDLGKAFDALPQ